MTLPSERIEELAKGRLNIERAKGMYLFPEEMLQETAIQSIIDYLNEQYFIKQDLEKGKDVCTNCGHEFTHGRV